MKIDLSKIKSTTSANTTTSPIVPKFDADVTAQAAAYTDNTSVASASTGISYDSSVTSPASNESENKGFSLTFTSGATYDLDALIAEKRRNSTTCPLILKLDTANENDAYILKTITELILDDYLVEYNEDESSDVYYKKQITKVPDYYNVFDYYFNKLYGYYVSAKKEGEIGLNTIVENINGIKHSEILAYLTTGVSETAASQSDYNNKTKVEWEYGTKSEDDTTAKTEIETLKAKIASLSLQITEATNKFNSASSLKLKATKSDTGHMEFFWYNADTYNEIAGESGLSEDGTDLVIDMSKDNALVASIDGTSLLMHVYSIDETTGSVVCYGW